MEEGDIIATVSDGIHDNLDPQIQGLSPEIFGLEYEDWSNVPLRWASALKTSYMCHLAMELLKGSPVTPAHMKNTLIQNSLELTTRSRLVSNIFLL